MNKIKIPHCWLILVRAYGLKRENKKKKNEEGRREEKNPGLEHLFGCKETIVRMLVWNCLETLVLEILV